MQVKPFHGFSEIKTVEFRLAFERICRAYLRQCAGCEYLSPWPLSLVFDSDVTSNGFPPFLTTEYMVNFPTYD